MCVWVCVCGCVCVWEGGAVEGSVGVRVGVASGGGEIELLSLHKYRRDYNRV